PAVGRFIETAVRPLERAVLPRPLPRLPQRRIDGLRVRRIDGHFDAARVLVAVQDLVERLAAIGGAENAALGVRSVRVAEDGDEEAVRIVRVDGDGRDLLAIAQTEVRPRRAGVGGLVDAVAGGEVGALQPFAAADVEDVRIRRRDGDRADRAGRLL